jgi:outer membrane protein TolC
MRSLLWLSLVACVALANDSEILSSLKQEQLRLEYKHNELTSDNLKLDWLNPITGSWSWTRTENSIQNTVENSGFAVSLDQPIFKSGGIYFAMRYADANRGFLHLATQLEEQNLIKQAMNLALRYQKTQLQLERVNLQIKNASIDIVRKKEQYEAGLIDSSDLDQALLTKNTQEHSLLDLRTALREIEKEFQTLSDAPLEALRLPHFEMMDETTFLASSLAVQHQASAHERSQWLQKATTSNYLPTVSINAGYYDRRDETRMRASEDSYYTYGIKISMPLYDVNRARSIELKRIETLQAGLKLQDVKRSEEKLYQSTYETVNYLKEKYRISLENYKLYGELLASTQELAGAGERTSYDVQTLENSRQTMYIDAKVNEIDMQLSLLSLYAKMQGEI